MLCFTHAAKNLPQTLRIDYIAELDGLLIGIEVKAPPDKAVELGRDLFQCAQYAQGIIAPHVNTPQEWVGKALWGVFFASDGRYCREYVRQHGTYAQRLYGPANVGFLNRRCRHADCFELFMSGERAWSKEWGWHRGMIKKASRTGNGSTNFVDTQNVTFPVQEEQNTYPRVAYSIEGRHVGG